MDKVVYEKRDRIGYVTLNRPEALNALDDGLNDALWDVWADFNADDSTDIAIVTGAGKAFCSGADLTTFIPKREHATMLAARETGVVAVVIPFGALGALIALNYAGEVWRDVHRGITSEAAFLLSFLLGVLALTRGVMEPRQKIFVVASLAVVATFLLIVLLGYRSVKLSEQRSIWVGMAKETAHQLGTPISSLMGWVEILKERNSAGRDGGPGRPPAEPPRI